MDGSCAKYPPASEQCSAPRTPCYRPWAHLPSLAIRRTAASLACLYKLHYLPGPPQLLSVLPPRHSTSANPRTRSEHGSVSGHDHQLQHQLPASAPPPPGAAALVPTLQHQRLELPPYRSSVPASPRQENAIIRNERLSPSSQHKLALGSRFPMNSMMLW